MWPRVIGLPARGVHNEFAECSRDLSCSLFFVDRHSSRLLPPGPPKALEARDGGAGGGGGGPGLGASGAAQTNRCR